MSDFSSRLLQFPRKKISSAIIRLEEGMGKRSLIGDTPFFPEDTFPWAATLEANWKEIRSELDQLLAYREELPNFQDISVEQRALTDDNDWKTYFFAGYGLTFAQNRDRCPRTVELLDGIDGLTTAFFSILAPGKHIPPHRGPYKGVIRYHLGLKIPAPETSCGISVDEQTAHWQEGRSMVFDDTYVHEAWNDTDQDRVVLFLDILRPLPFPYALLNRLALKYIARSSFVRGAKDKHDAWEKRFEELRRVG
ncbi:aspartyl/asparaginyl beta-hydroxylase domain-containing protein [Streptacidiphilus griseoplanus]|uniref:aspartyl/asparaginyl beta-hydroxylase domain-containing protein n=1 Tax=Peterkaempfera griseoplana TaxID=66896 RepID=UPI0006E36D90|nr:aspartyl/asparaginyl beta-hydroxylase domain-containing protein [Peterkaempfera griseoplana]